MTSQDDQETDEEFDPSMQDIAEHIGFKVKARATDANIETHNWFKQLAWDKFDGDYTETLRALKQMWEVDWKYKSLYNDIEDLKRRVQLIETNMASESELDNDDEEDDEEAF